MKRMKSLFSVFVLVLITVTPLYAAKKDALAGLKKHFPEWSMQPFLALTLWQWIGIGGAILAGLILRKFVGLILKGVHHFVSSRSKTEWDDRVIEAFIGPSGTLAAVGLWLACLYILNLPKGLTEFVEVILQVIASISLIILAYRLTNVFIVFLKQLSAKTETDLDDQLMPVIEKTLKILVVGFGVMVALQNLGINVLSAMAGLGIGGLAFALAAKDTLANMFGSFTIFMDQPFKVGDWVKINNGNEGTVESIGLRTTKIRTFGKTLISLPNALIANSSIENISARPLRRIYAKIGITYDTPAEKLEAIINDIRTLISENQYSVEDNKQIYFTDYADSSLKIMLYFFVEVASWTEELEAKQSIFIEIKKALERHDVDFAFPTQTIHVESLPVKAGEPPLQ